MKVFYARQFLKFRAWCAGECTQKIKIFCMCRTDNGRFGQAWGERDAFQK